MSIITSYDEMTSFEKLINETLAHHFVLQGVKGLICGCGFADQETSFPEYQWRYHVASVLASAGVELHI
jgi:hypothetical protein